MPDRESQRRRILSLWFPRLGAERVLRAESGLAETPLVTVAEIGNLRQIAATTALIAATGVASTTMSHLAASLSDPARTPNRHASSAQQGFWS